jgi:hypothetical protein
MGAWRAAGARHSGFFGSTLLSIDDEARGQDPALGDGRFPGWCAVLRHGWGTQNETALWLLAGDFYRDHRHADRGGVVLYALGAPLSLDWGSLYSPQAAGAFLHSLVLPESRTGHPWDKGDPPLNGGAGWETSSQEAFLSFAASARATARMTCPVAPPGGQKSELAWVRSVTSLHPDEAHPVIIIKDTFTGPAAGGPKVFSLNLMAKGPVATPAGEVSPPLRSYKDDKALPSAGAVFDLPPGLNRLGFTGQWLIDWDLYTVADEAQRAHVGNWAHDWHPETEKGEFRAANKADFEERQHILRIRGEKQFQVLILPYRKGEKRDDVRVRREGETVTVSGEGQTTVVGDDYYAYRDGEKRVLATFGRRSAEGAGARAAGGPVEIIVRADRVTVTAHGEAGARKFTLPGSWTVAEPPKGGSLLLKGGDWQLDYPGGAPLTIVLRKT